MSEDESEERYDDTRTPQQNYRNSKRAEVGYETKELQTSNGSTADATNNYELQK